MYGFVFGTQIVKKRIGRNGHTSKLKREIEKNFGNQTSVIFSAEELDVLGREQGEESWDVLGQALGYCQERDTNRYNLSPFPREDCLDLP